MTSQAKAKVLSAEPLPYRPDTSAWFSHLAGRPWSALLETGLASGPAASPGWDIAVAEPRSRLVTRGPHTEITGPAGIRTSGADPFDLLRQALGPALAPPEVPGLPFVGGALGWLGYDLGRRLERLPATAADPLALPELCVGLYDWAILVDHGARRAWIAGRADADPEARVRLLDAYRAPVPLDSGPFVTRGPVETNLDARAYAERFARLQAYIQAGDCYQANLARRFCVAARGDPWSAYLRLRGLSPAPFAAFLRGPESGTAVLSASPERFIRVRDGRVETSPIKGTAPRGATPEQDRALAAALRASPKERAENLMIVDLLRNDLGRNCAIGSIAVPRLFEVQTLPGLHHLVSTVTGRLAPHTDAIGLLRGAFPGGSITGAPKIRAMEIIEELEGERRGVYCGAIGYIGFDGAMDTSIAIRTAVHLEDQLWFWAGGGIVADSDPEREAAEIEVKARAMLQLVADSRD